MKVGDRVECTSAKLQGVIGYGPLTYRDEECWIVRLDNPINHSSATTYDIIVATVNMKSLKTRWEGYLWTVTWEFGVITVSTSTHNTILNGTVQQAESLARTIGIKV